LFTIYNNIIVAFKPSLIPSLMGTNNETLVFVLQRYTKRLMYAETVGVIIVYEEQYVTTVTIQILSIKNCSSTQYENKHELFVTDLLNLT